MCSLVFLFDLEKERLLMILVVTLGKGRALPVDSRIHDGSSIPDIIRTQIHVQNIITS
jgi:hypothetical protein